MYPNKQDTAIFSEVFAVVKMLERKFGMNYSCI